MKLGNTCLMLMMDFSVFRSQTDPCRGCSFITELDIHAARIENL